MIWSVLFKGLQYLSYRGPYLRKRHENQGSLPCHCARDTETAHPQQGEISRQEFSIVHWQSKRGRTWSKSSSSPPPSLYASINDKLYAVTFQRDRSRKCNSVFNIMIPKLTHIGTHRMNIGYTQGGYVLLFKILAPLCFTDLSLQSVECL